MALNISAEQYEKLKKIHSPGTVQTVQWKYLSQPFDKKTTEKLKTFCEVSQLFDESENSVSCDYYTPYELNKIKVKQEDLSVLHLNISSLSAHKKNPQTTNINFAGYNIEHTPTESSAGGVLLYISEKLSYKPCKDLQIYCPKELE